MEQFIYGTSSFVDDCFSLDLSCMIPIDLIYIRPILNRQTSSFWSKHYYSKVVFLKVVILSKLSFYKLKYFFLKNSCNLRNKMHPSHFLFIVK